MKPSGALLLALGLAAASCTPRGGGGNLPDDDDDSATDDDDDSTEDQDWDDDGLPNDFEKAIGSNPANEDSDDDGFKDGVEYFSYFRPWDTTDFPYAGDYPRGPIPDSVAGEGFDQGQISAGWSHLDQFEEELYLHRFYGNVVVVYVDTEEAAGLFGAATETQAAYEELRDEGFVVLSFVIGGVDFGTPPNAERFIADHDLSYPVFEHANQSISASYQFAPFLPHFSVLDRELRIRALSFSGINEWADARALAEQLLEEEAPEVDWPLP